MRSLAISISALLILSTLLLESGVNGQGKVLLISLDGFRWDYLNKGNTPNLDQLIAEGVHVEKVKNAFATLTMPNHWTLVTGLYEENHGIIANSFYDAEFDDRYSFSTDSKWYNNTEPIWIAAEKDGKHSGAYMWVGNQALYNGMGPRKVVPFKSNPSFETGLDTVVDWFSSDSLTFACLYTDQPDKDGHRYGPNSIEVVTRVMELDTLLGGLMQKFDDLGLKDRVNIIIASDHGMTDVSNANSIDLSQYIDFKNEVEWSYASAIGLITPKAGMLDQVYNKLKDAERNKSHMTVYKKADIPNSLNYKDNKRITDIVIIPDNGWLLKRSGYTVSLKGNHGFNNSVSDMMTTLIARGPDFKPGQKKDTIRSVDVYPMLCHILCLSTCHENNGSLANTLELLRNQSCDAVPTPTAAPTPNQSSTTENSSSSVKPWLVMLLVSTLTCVLKS